MWDPPGPGLEPASPASAGGLLTAAPPGTPPQGFIGRYPGGGGSRAYMEPPVEYGLNKRLFI